MKMLVTVLFLLAAMVNLAPSVGVLSGARLEALYGITVRDPNLLLLMRHRAVLFAVVGGLLLAGAFHPPLRDVATLCGMLSMVSFVVLAMLTEGINPSLNRVLLIDLVAIVLLVGGWGIGRFERG